MGITLEVTSRHDRRLRKLDVRFGGLVDRNVGRSRYAEQSSPVPARFTLHSHPLNSDGVILQHFVRTQQHEPQHHG